MLIRAKRTADRDLARGQRFHKFPEKALAASFGEPGAAGHQVKPWRKAQRGKELARIEYLDGLRGLAALWVLVGHCMLLTGFFLPVIGQPDLGVDLFILLSGFVMAYQYRLRSEVEDWGKWGTWLSFWTRRFFRIAPLFYVALAVALALGPLLYSDRVAIDSFFGRSLQPADRYLDGSLTNVVMHATFLFGLTPSYAYRTPLPDWSIGLEMQFYAAFPFLVLLARNTSWLRAAMLACLASVSIVMLITAAGISFPMPAFLPLKMPLFICGMLTAAVIGGDRLRLAATGGLILAFAAIPTGGTQDLLHVAVRAMVAGGFFALVHFHGALLISLCSRLLATPPFRWLGELSYGVYLIHLLILQPVAASVIASFGHGISSPERFLIVFSIVAPAAYALAFATYRFIEMPGQKLGKALTHRSRQAQRQGGLARIDEIAAP